MKIEKFTYEFVEFVPENLKDGVLYVSISYATALHKCACGCGHEVVTPLSPTDWKMTFDGVSVSLDPSIGNWSFPCKSHYWISKNNVRWSYKWSDERINSARAKNQALKNKYYQKKEQVGSANRPENASEDWFSKVKKTVKKLSDS